MNTTAKVAIGAIIGGGIGWFIGSVIEAYLEIIEEELSCPYSGSEEWPEKFENTEKENTDVSKRVKVERTDYTKRYIPTENDKTELAMFARKYNQGILPVSEEDEAIARLEIGEEPPEESDIPEAEDIDLEDDDDSGIIRIISKMEFASGDKGYPQFTLSYYEDDVLTDERNIPIRRPEDLIGPDALVSFGELSEDDDVVYVRNNIKKVEYEVVRTGNQYPARQERKRITRTLPKTVEEKDNEEQDT